jgi:hypothetical protein
VSPTPFGLPSEKKHEAVAFVEGDGARFAEVSECGEAGSRCSPTLYLHELVYPGDSVPRINEPSSGWNVISYDNFDLGWGQYSPGGPLANVVNTATACSDGNVAELKGNGVDGSFQNVWDKWCDEYSLLRVTFQFSFKSYDHLDTFLLEVSLDSGNNYSVVKYWARDANTRFNEDDVCYNERVLLSPEQFRVRSFGDRVRLRFRSSTDSTSADAVYIGNIAFDGYTYR